MYDNSKKLLADDDYQQIRCTLEYLRMLKEPIGSWLVMGSYKKGSRRRFDSSLMVELKSCQPRNLASSFNTPKEIERFMRFVALKT